jgi:transcriptional regulator with XRE-family HTH domain
MTDQNMNTDADESNSLRSTRDYRDDLRDLLDAANNKTGISRYRLCKQMGIDSGTLSNVLAKRRHFSLDKLIQLLALLGYRLTFAAVKGSKN